MKIHAYFVCYNEEKILPVILDYYSGFCSKIFIFDNGSVDESIAIATTYPNVKVIPFDTGGLKDNKKHVQIKTQAYKEYSRSGGRFTEEIADWVICCDMDEIIYHHDLISILSEYDRLHVTVPQVTGFDMVDVNDVDTSIPILSQYKSGVRNSVFDKRAIFKPSFDMSYSLGCHSNGPGFELMKETYGYKTSNKYPIAMLHYKHVGGLLHESAVKNLSRFDMDKMEKDASGKYRGPGSQYAFFKDKGPNFSPFLRNSKPVLNDKNEVLFENFPPTTGEVGTEQSSGKVIEQTDVEFIRDAALSLEQSDLDLSFKLISLAYRFRPNGPVIKRKYEELKERSYGAIT